MASEVSIVNGALAILGARRINSFSEDSEQAALANEHYADLRDEVLRAYPWNFAGARAALAADPVPPAWEYNFRYGLPADLLWMRFVEGQDLFIRETRPIVRQGIGWRVEGRFLLTDLTAPLNIKYTRRETDPNIFDDLFRKALSAKIAMEWAERLTGTSTKLADAAGLYQAQLNEARAIDGQEQTPDVIETSEWILARYG